MYSSTPYKLSYAKFQWFIYYLLTYLLTYLLIYSMVHDIILKANSH